MTRKFLWHSLIFLILGSAFFAQPKDTRAAQPPNPKTVVLYDAAVGSLPDPSLLSFTAFPSDAISINFADGAARLDTTPAGSDAYAGWTSNSGLLPSFPVLDRAAGLQLNFRLQIEHESHASENRAGFSVILLDQDAKGIELSFWQDQIWTQNDPYTGGLFTHGESVAFATTALTEYQITFNGESYTLHANAAPILTGPLRDYSSFEGFLDPYETPNFLFMGDDTTSAQSRLNLYFVSITGTEAVPTASTATVAVAPSSTAIPTLTPGNGDFEICPSGWLLPGFLFASTLVTVKLRRRYQQPD